MEEAERLCDEIMIMNSGRIIAQGEPSTLIRSLNAEYTFTVEFGKNQFRPDLLAGIRHSTDHEWDDRTQSLKGMARDMALALEEIIAIGREHKVKIMDIDIVRPSLEDVFLSHTGKELRE